MGARGRRINDRGGNSLGSFKLAILALSVLQYDVKGCEK
jgi:hypothetical protein